MFREISYAQQRPDPAALPCFKHLNRARPDGLYKRSTILAGLEFEFEILLISPLKIESWKRQANYQKTIL